MGMWNLSDWSDFTAAGERVFLQSSRIKLHVEAVADQLPEVNGGREQTRGLFVRRARDRSPQRRNLKGSDNDTGYQDQQIALADRADCSASADQPGGFEGVGPRAATRIGAARAPRIPGIEREGRHGIADGEKLACGTLEPSHGGGRSGRLGRPAGGGRRR